MKKRRKKRKRPRRSRKSAKPRSPAGGIQIVTPEGDAFVFTNAHYQHAALEDILQITLTAGSMRFSFLKGSA